MASVAEDKAVKDYLVNFGKQLNQLVKQAKVKPDVVAEEDNLDNLARRAGLIEKQKTRGQGN